jgi:hypothetical protein
MSASRQKRPIRNSHSGESKKHFVSRPVLRQRDCAAEQQNLPKADILEKSVFYCRPTTDIVIGPPEEGRHNVPIFYGGARSSPEATSATSHPPPRARYRLTRFVAICVSLSARSFSLCSNWACVEMTFKKSIAPSE